MDNYIIRNEKKEDYFTVENLTREAFWNVYRPGCLEHYVLHCFRMDKDFVPELNFVMEMNGKIIGHVMFAKAIISADDGRKIEVLTFGPISISPEFKRQGFGKKLLDYSLEKAKDLGYKAVAMTGNIDFYGKCGFTEAYKMGIRYHADENSDAPYFLIKELEKDYLKGITGVFKEPDGYFIDENKAEEFDKIFPTKQKLKLPGQLF